MAAEIRQLPSNFRGRPSVTTSTSHQTGEANVHCPLRGYENEVLSTAFLKRTGGIVL